MVKEDMSSDIHANRFLSTIAWGLRGSFRGANVDSRLEHVRDMVQVRERPEVNFTAYIGLFAPLQ